MQVNKEFSVPIWSADTFREFLQECTDRGPEFISDIIKIEYTERFAYILTIFSITVQGREQAIKIMFDLIKSKLVEC